MTILDSNSVNPPVTLPKTRPVNLGVTRPRDLIGPQPCGFKATFSMSDPRDKLAARRLPDSCALLGDLGASSGGARDKALDPTQPQPSLLGELDSG